MQHQKDWQVYLHPALFSAHITLAKHLKSFVTWS